MKNIEFKGVSYLLLMVIFGLFSACNKDDTEFQPKTNSLRSQNPIFPTDVNSILIGKGELYGAGDENIPQQNMVISNTADWNDLKNKMNSVNDVTSTFSEPDVDFSNFMVIAIFDEVQMNGGYSVNVTDIVEDENNITVTVEYVSPSGLVTTAITQPFYIIKIPRSQKPIVFN